MNAICQKNRKSAFSCFIEHLVSESAFTMVLIRSMLFQVYRAKKERKNETYSAKREQVEEMKKIYLVDKGFDITM